VLDNVVRITEPTGLQTELTYDESNNIVALTQPDDREFLFGRDSLGRIISETNPLGQTTIYSYNIIGQIGRITNPLGIVQSFSWFGNDRIARYAVSDGIQYEYISDDIGRLTDIVDLGTEQSSAVNTRIVYDVLGQ